VIFFEKPIILKIPEKIKIRYIKKEIKISSSEKEIKLHDKGFSRIISILIVYAVLLVILVVFLSNIIPRISEEFNNFVQNIPMIMGNIENMINRSIEYIEPNLSPKYREILNQSIDRFIEQTQQYTYRAISYSFEIAGKLISLALTLIIIPFFTFYILLDLEKYKNAFQLILPEVRKNEINELLHQIDLVLGKYIRAQILAGFFIGISITIALSLLGIDYAFLIGLLSGIFNFIPYVGVIVSIFPAAIIALLKHNFIYALTTVVVVEALQILEGQLITPAVIGQVLKLPPLVIIIALIIGGEIWGFLGVLIAIPVVAILKIVILYYLELKRNRILSSFDNLI
jgi:predicted PurR-regulated permease PerM